LSAWLSLLAVYFFWGTTYLGIRVALETIPPVTLVATRFLLSGAILWLVAWWRGAHLPRGRELWRTSLNGLSTLGVGNGCLAIAEQWVPSGLAALLITATGPVWMNALESWVPGGERFHWRSAWGMLIAFSGAAVLLAPGLDGSALAPGMLAGAAVLQLGNAGWAAGSIFQKRLGAQAHPIVAGAVQQLATGLVYLVPAALFELPHLHWTAQGVWAILYLATFGSIVGYSAYLYALTKLPVSLVSTYTYVNPVVAVALGWLFYREPFGARQWLSMATIFLGVFCIQRMRKSK
jgi:drug/metabolite transporter (DMT)-like permease